tara:strand:+ start:19084 stop:19290 length:207 start_codon:yes stop_codon:yes gene_type:complete
MSNDTKYNMSDYDKAFGTINELMDKFETDMENSDSPPTKDYALFVAQCLRIVEEKARRIKELEKARIK